MKAFPSKNAPYYINNEGASLHQAGMDLRDYFAAKALPVLIGAAGGVDETVKAAYMWADAMMKAREQ